MRLCLADLFGPKLDETLPSAQSLPRPEPREPGMEGVRKEKGAGTLYLAAAILCTGLPEQAGHKDGIRTEQAQ